MTDDDLARRLEAWAEATDPATDPVTPDDIAEAVEAAPTAPVHRRSGRRVLAAAAAVLVLAGVGAAVVVTRDDEPPPVVTDDGGPGGGPRTQVVVATPDGGPFDERDVRQRYSLHGPCGERSAEACAVEVAPVDEGPLRHGTSLIADQALEPGRWALVLERYGCGSAGCLTTDAAGRPDNQGTTVQSCTTALEVTAEPARLTRDLGDGGCEDPGTGDAPALDVPPAWTLRPDLPWDCGQVFSNHVDPSTYAPERDVETLMCMSEADEVGRPVELPIPQEAGGPRFREAWWRTGPDGTIEVMRTSGVDGRWTTSTCGGITIGQTTAPASPTHADLVDCTDEEPLSLDLPPLDSPVPETPATTSATAATAAIDVVLDVQGLGPLDEGPLFRWDLVTNGNQVRSGQVDRPGVILVATDPELTPGSRLTWSPYACGRPCPPAGDGGRPFIGVEPVEGITASPPICDLDLGPLDDAAVVVLRVRGETCTIEVADEVPALTAPPAWTLRAPTDVRCSIPVGGTAEDAGRCLGQARDTNLTAEWWTSDEDGRPLVWRVNATRDVDLVHPAAAGEPWTIEHCSGLGLMDVVPGPEIDGCGPEEPMALEP